MVLLTDSMIQIRLLGENFARRKYRSNMYFFKNLKSHNCYDNIAHVNNYHKQSQKRSLSER